MDILVNEIFYSIQGETTKAGFPSLFIRLCGCNLNCLYCDTVYAKSNGYAISIDKILENVKSYKSINHVTLTGGEPLLQDNSIHLMENLLKLGHSVQLETNGSISIKDVPRQVRKIVDVKTPSSGEAESFLLENLKFINKNDELKFVISDIDDYNYSKDFLEKHIEKNESVINFSPVLSKMSIFKTAELILVDRLRVRLNIQLHKIIWPGEEPKNY